MKNIKYKSENIAQYFSQNRIKWDDFYLSEREIISSIKPNENDKVLDVGCGCGGLGLALNERYNIINYTGIEINSQAVSLAKNKFPQLNIIEGDISIIEKKRTLKDEFDIVFSLSCVDWNLNFYNSLLSCWTFVKPGGSLVATFRLTNLNEGVNDIKSSYQFINYDNKKQCEIAPYVVLNKDILIKTLSKLNPSVISSYGYFGKPSLTAITPYDKLCFAAFSIVKREKDDFNEIKINMQLPI